MGSKLTKRAVEGFEPREKPTFLWDAGDGAVKGFGVCVNPSGKRTFVAQFRVRGKSKRVSIGSFGPWTVEQARDHAKALIRDADLGIDRDARDREAARAADAARAAAERERRSARDLRMNRLAARFMRDHVRVKLKQGSVDFYRHVVAAHILPALGKMDARHISRADVTALHNSLADRPAMANRVATVLSAIYGWAERLDLLPIDFRRPTFRLEKFKEHEKERFLTVAELRRLGEAIRQAEAIGIPWNPNPNGKTKHAPKAENRLTKIDPDAAAALRLLLFTGARLREILHLEWQFVDLERGLLRLRDSKTGPKTILLNSPARAVLVRLHQRGRYVFPGEGKNGREQPRADLKRPWRLVCKAAELEGVRIHDLRHSFASVGAADGHGLVVVGALLGHADASTTQRYAKVAPDPLRQAADAIAGKIAAAIGEGEPPDRSGTVVPIRGGEAR